MRGLLAHSFTLKSLKTKVPRTWGFLKKPGITVGGVFKLWDHRTLVFEISPLKRGLGSLSDPGYLGAAPRDDIVDALRNNQRTEWYITCAYRGFKNSHILRNICRQSCGFRVRSCRMLIPRKKILEMADPRSR